MTSETRFLLAQMVRHNRALVTSFENWTKQQPHSRATWELAELFRALREVLTGIEREVSADVEGVQADEVIN